MADWKLIDADGHVRETEDEVFNYLPEQYQGRREAMMYSPLLPNHGWHRQAGSKGGAYKIPTLEDWRKALDQGLEATVIYPTRFLHIGQVGIADYAVDLCRAYNDYLHDQFLRHESRMNGVALIPLQDPAAAVLELRRAVEDLGMVGGMLPADGPPVPLGHPQFHPVYEEAERLGCMLAVHSQNSLRNNDQYMWRHEAATLAHVWPQMRQLTNLIFSGVFRTYPGLRIAFLEAGSGWVPYLMSKMEDRLGDLPSIAELLTRHQIYFQAGEEMTTARDLEFLGDECLFWASDYPHEGIVDMGEAIREFVDRPDLSDDAKRKISYDNPKRLYGL